MTNPAFKDRRRFLWQSGSLGALAAYAEKHGLAKACRLLFNANEFVFVD